MKTYKAARHRCNGNRAYLSCSRDIDTIAQFELGTKLAAIAIAIAFGLCIFLGMM